jgi:hypothetical protein
MFGSAILDVAIGMIFVYLLMALVVTSLSELIASWLKWRAKNLADGLQKLLNSGPNQGLARDLYNHPLIKSLFKGDNGPSYIPSRTFALVLLDLISPVDPSSPRTGASIQTAIEKVPNKEVQTALSVLWEEAKGEVAAFEEGIEIWFNNQMERVSGWYKRKSQIINVVLAAAVTIAANADSILIAKALSSDPALRTALVAEAVSFAEQNTAESLSQETEEPADPAAARARAADAQKALLGYRDQIQKLGVPIGWAKADPTQPNAPDARSVPVDFWGWVRKFLGLLLTAVAASLGAPFWFDMLNKVMNIRSAGKAPEERPKSPKVRQTPPEPGETPREASEREDATGDSTK